MITIFKQSVPLLISFLRVLVCLPPGFSGNPDLEFKDRHFFHVDISSGILNLATEVLPDTAAILPGKDSVFINPVFLCEDSDNKFVYRCELRSPVCSDTLCRVVRILIFWDLAGDFVRFDTLQGWPLTKYDHKPFTTSDYIKLQNTLEDENSILARKGEDELLDINKSRYSEKIDGITGATAVQIQNTVVEGALYSTYTLWHLANGKIRRDLLTHTLENYNHEIEYQMLYSGKTHQVLIALKQWKDHDFISRFPEVIRILKDGDPLVNFYMAKKLPVDLYRSKQNIKSLTEIWDSLDPNTKSVLSKHINQE